MLESRRLYPSPEVGNQLPLIKQMPSSIRLITYLDLDTFKIHPCSIKVPHNHKQCQFYHYPKDRKRPGFQYSTDLCEYIEREQECAYGESCPKSHNRVEQLYTPNKYKMRFCSFYPNNLSKCEYGEFCSFAHNENEISIDLIHHYEYDDDFYVFHYKTIWCPFNQNKHDKSVCVYAHNWQDFRRKPQQYKYDPMPCLNWKTKDYVTNYEDGCKFTLNCDKCHGWKEFDYHPLNYRTKPCGNGVNCLKKRECTYYHGENEKREIENGIQYKIFKYRPRNRVLKNTYKNEECENIYSFENGAQTYDNNSFGNLSCQSNSMTFSWPKQMAFGADNKNMNFKKTQSPNKSPEHYNFFGNMESSDHSGYRNQYFKNKNQSQSPDFMKNGVQMQSPEITNPMMTNSNPQNLNFSLPLNFNNTQAFNPNYANELQEQFFKLTQFSQEKSYKLKKTDITPKNETDMNDDELMDLTLNEIQKNLEEKCDEEFSQEY